MEDNSSAHNDGNRQKRKTNKKKNKKNVTGTPGCTLIVHI